MVDVWRENSVYIFKCLYTMFYNMAHANMVLPIPQNIPTYSIFIVQQRKPISQNESKYSMLYCYQTTMHLHANA